MLGKTGDIIMFVHFEERDLLSETCNGTKIVNEYDEHSTLAPFIIE